MSDGFQEYEEERIAREMDEAAFYEAVLQPYYELLQPHDASTCGGPESCYWCALAEEHAREATTNE